MLSIRYLDENPIFRGKGLSVRGIGLHEVMLPSFIERPHGTGDYLFMVFYDAVQFGPQRQPLEPSSIALWDRGSAHFYGNVHRRWTHSWVHCDGAVVRRLFGEIGRHEPFVGPCDPSAVDRHLSALHDEVRTAGGGDPVIVRNLLENLLRVATRGRQRLPWVKIDPRLAEARAYLDTHYHERITLSSLARRSGLSPRHFCTEFRRAVGAAPMTYLIYRRLNAAATLIRGTNQPIGVIGASVGYRDPYYFSKHFKMCFGVPPRALRNGSTNGHE